MIGKSLHSLNIRSSALGHVFGRDICFSLCETFESIGASREID